MSQQDYSALDKVTALDKGFRKNSDENVLYEAMRQARFEAKNGNVMIVDNYLELVETGASRLGKEPQYFESKPDEIIEIKTDALINGISNVMTDIYKYISLEEPEWVVACFYSLDQFAERLSSSRPDWEQSPTEVLESLGFPAAEIDPIEIDALTKCIHLCMGRARNYAYAADSMDDDDVLADEPQSHYYSGEKFYEDLRNATEYAERLSELGSDPEKLLPRQILENLGYPAGEIMMITIEGDAKFAAENATRLAIVRHGLSGESAERFIDPKWEKGPSKPRLIM